MRCCVGGRGECEVVRGARAGFDAVAREDGDVEVRGRISARAMFRRWECVGLRWS